MRAPHCRVCFVAPVVSLQGSFPIQGEALFPRCSTTLHWLETPDARLTRVLWRDFCLLGTVSAICRISGTRHVALNPPLRKRENQKRRWSLARRTNSWRRGERFFSFR